MKFWLYGKKEEFAMGIQYAKERFLIDEEVEYESVSKNHPKQSVLCFTKNNSDYIGIIANDELSNNIAIDAKIVKIFKLYKNHANKNKIFYVATGIQKKESPAMSSLSALQELGFQAFGRPGVTVPKLQLEHLKNNKINIKIIDGTCWIEVLDKQNLISKQNYGRVVLIALICQKRSIKLKIKMNTKKDGMNGPTAEMVEIIKECNGEIYGS